MSPLYIFDARAGKAIYRRRCRQSPLSPAANALDRHLACKYFDADTDRRRVDDISPLRRRDLVI